MPGHGIGPVSPTGPDPFAPPATQFLYQPQPSTSAFVSPVYTGTAPAGTQLFYSSAQYQTEVAQDLGSTLIISGLPPVYRYPYKLLLEWGTANQEVVIITSAPTGNGPYTFTGVLRGQDGGGPQITHSAGAQVNHGVSAADFFQIAPVFNVCDTQYGGGADPTGTIDSYAAIQAALTAAMNAGGGTVWASPGIYLTSNMLQIGSNTQLLGVPGATTIQAKSGSWGNVAQVGGINGLGVLITYGNNTASNITVNGITFDGNQTGITYVPLWSAFVTCSPLHLNNITNLTISNCQSINTIGYGVYLQECSNFKVTGCNVVTGQVSAAQAWGTPSQQDGIHLDSCIYGAVADNYVDTGSFSNDIGDDCIALQSYNPVHDITITGNVLNSGESGIDLALSGANIYNITISGNVVRQAQAAGVIVQPFVAGSATASNIAITGNSLYNTGGNGTADGAAISLYDYSAVSSSGPTFKGVTITGNTIATTTNTTLSGVYTQSGSDLIVSNNVISNWVGFGGIQLGDTGRGVTNFTASCNVIDMSAESVANPCGLFSIDSSFGLYSCNMINGPGTGVSAGYGLLIQATSTGATNIVMVGNQVSNWVNGIAEYNDGIAPNTNVITNNNVYNCTVPVTTTGPQTVTGGYLPLVQATSATTGTTGTGSQNITGLVSPTLNIGAYYLEVTISWEPTVSGSTTGFGFSASTLVFSALSLSYSIFGEGTTQAGAAGIVTSTTLADNMFVSGARTSTSGYGTCRIWGTVTVSTAGTIQAVFVNTNTADTATIAAGATMLIRPLN